MEWLHPIACLRAEVRVLAGAYLRLLVFLQAHLWLEEFISLGLGPKFSCLRSGSLSAPRGCQLIVPLWPNTHIKGELEFLRPAGKYLLLFFPFSACLVRPGPPRIMSLYMNSKATD